MQSQKSTPLKLSKDTKHKLATAYYSLYENIVAIALENGKTFGQSWYEAIQHMEHILNAQKETFNDTPAMKYVDALFKSHKSEVQKKAMLSINKDKTTTNQNNKNLLVSPKTTETIQSLNKLVDLLGANNTNVNKNVLTQVIIPTQDNNFQKWIENNPAALASINENDPSSFAKLYRMYILENRHTRH